jgi:DNA-binding NtrC family response regulator
VNDELCLLIVDDDKDLLDPLIEVCERFHFKVVSASSGQRAIDLVDQHDVDVVLTDIRMQPMGGFALLEKVRALRSDLPFILCTGFWDRLDEKRAASFENVERLEKPFTFLELELMLQRIREKVLASRVRA